MGMALPFSCTLAGVQTGTILLPASFSEYCWSHGITCALALYLQHTHCLSICHAGHYTCLKLAALHLLLLRT